MSEYVVKVLYDGYSRLSEGEMYANCTCTLIKGQKNIIIDTMTAWDREKIISGLSSEGLCPDDIHYAIATHGHSDHLGNLNLFTNATHIVGFTIHKGDRFYIHPFENGEAYQIDDYVKVIPTPGHTHADVSVQVQDSHQHLYVVAGDLFEKVEDLDNPSIWRDDAGSEDPDSQEKHRRSVLQIADFIIPGHGPMFKVTDLMKNK